MSSQDTESISHSVWDSLKTHLSPETIQTPPSSVNSGIAENERSSLKPASEGSRLSFRSSKLSRFLSSSESPHPRPGSFSFSSLRGSAEPPDPGKLSELRSEISSNSSASQIRSTVRSLAKKFDRIEISSRAADFSSNIGLLMDRLSPAPQEAKDTSVDILDLQGRKLEMVLDAALGISEQLQVKFFDKHRVVVSGDERAQNLEMQNARIRTLDDKMFITVAFYGDNGTGKSSLINALLDNECITPTSNGASCTAVPIEFRMLDRGQNLKKNYTVIADVLTDEEWLPLAEKLLEDLDEDPSDMKTDTTRNILQPLFNLLEDGVPITLAMIEKLPFNRAEPTGFNRRFATQELSELRKHVGDLNTFYWPVLNKITIYMDSPVLNTGVILIDLPGLRDSSPMKMETIYRYLKACETIFVVSNISHTVDSVNHLLSDPMIKPIARQAELNGSSKISFIFTQTDKIKGTANTSNSRKKGVIRKRIEETRQLFRDPSQCRAHKAELFCVSSSEYQWHHKRLVGPNTDPCLNSDDSEIPALRAFIQKKGLRQRGSVMESLIEGNMKTLIHSIQGWCEEQGTAPPLTHDTHRFESLTENFNEVLARHGWKLFADNVRSFKDKIREEGVEEAVAEAVKAIDSWSKMKYNTFEAACREGGDKETGVRVVHLNRDLAVPITKKIKSWEEIYHLYLGFSDTPNSQTQMLGGLASFFYQEIRESVNTSYELSNIHSQIYRGVRRQEDIWQRSLTKMPGEIFILNHEPAIKQRMGPAYNQCTSLSGHGVKAAREKIMKDAVPVIMREYCTSLRNDIFQKLDELIVRVKESLETELRDILDTVKSTYFSLPKTETADLSEIKLELLEFSKIMKELEIRFRQLQALELCL